MKFASILLLTAIFSGSACAGDRALPANISAQTVVESSTHLNVYSYSVSSLGTNDAPLETLTIKLAPGVDIVTGIVSPPGWRAFYSPEQGSLMWAATGYHDPHAANAEGDFPPSDFAIDPGNTLSGFGYKSFGQPGTVTAYIQAYRAVRTLSNEFDEEAAEVDKGGSMLPEENALLLTTIGPQPTVTWNGNRRPAVDGFLVFVNVQPRSVFQGSALIVFRLAAAGEQVDLSTLHVDLNGKDVTDFFVYLDEYRGYAAIFDLGTSPIQLGNNVLKTSVDGTVPDSHRLATDSDRLVFSLVQ